MAKRVNDGVELIKTLAGNGRVGSRPKPPKAVARSASLEAPRPLPDHEKAKRRLTAKTVAFTAEDEKTAVERILSDHLLRLRRKAIEPGTQIDRLAGEEYFRPRRQADHVAPFIARNTRDNAFSLTKASTLIRAPFASTISIPPAPLSLARIGRGGCGCGGASIAVSRWLAPLNTPSGMNGAVIGGCISAAAFQAARQLYSTLSEIR
jgi:hypothetical protein